MKCRWLGEKIFIGIFGSTLHSLLYSSLSCLTESCSFGKGFKDPLPLHQLDIKVVGDQAYACMRI